MLSPKLIAIVAVIWIFGVILGGTFNYSNTEASWTGNSNDANSVLHNGAGQISDVQYLLNYKNAVQTIDVLGVIPLPVPNANYFKVMFSILFLRFSFLVTNPYGEFFWYFFLLPIALIGVVGAIMTFLALVRGNISWG